MSCTSCSENKLLPNTDCSTPEVCPEFLLTDCIIYTGVDIVSLDIKNGDKLTDVLTKLIDQALICNP